MAMSVGRWGGPGVQLRDAPAWKQHYSGDYGEEVVRHPKRRQDEDRSWHGWSGAAQAWRDGEAVDWSSAAWCAAAPAPCAWPGPVLLEPRRDWDAEPASAPEVLDLARQKVYVVGDSVMRGLQKLFHTGYTQRSWRVDANSGMEALSVPCTETELKDYDHIFYCSAGNAIWKDDKEWKAVQRNIQSFDPRRISVVLLGSAEFWMRLAGPEYPPKQASFFEDAKRLLRQQRVHVAELTTCVENLEFADSEGHPSKAARHELVPRLMEVFRELAKRRPAQEEE